MDDYISTFVDQFGEPTNHIPATPQTLNQLQGVVPDSLINCFKVLGFSEFQHGLVHLVNPLDWEPIGASILTEISIAKQDRLVPYLKGAFGQLDLVGLNTGFHPRIRLMQEEVLVFQDDLDLATKQGVESVFQLNFSAFDPEDYDLLDDEQQPLFESLLAKLGKPTAEQIFGLPKGATFYDTGFEALFSIVTASDHLPQYIQDSPLTLKLI